MPKTIYCAECGTELFLLYKALPKQQKVITVILPHTCPDETPEFPFKDSNSELISKPPESKPDLDSAFNKLKFVSKLNDLNPKPSINPILTSEPGDKRPKDQLIDNTIAPSGVLSAIKSNNLSTGPEKD